MSKVIIFYTKSKYIRYTLASYGVIPLEKYLEAFHDQCVLLCILK